MAETNFKDLLEILERKWCEPIGLIAAAFTAIVLVAAVLVPAEVKGLSFIATTTVAVAVVTLFWALNRNVPRTPKGKIGFYVSIYSSDDVESQRLREDFVQPLREYVRSGRSGERIHFQEVPNAKAFRLVNKEPAIKFFRNKKAHFLMYGRVRNRKLYGEEHHVIDLQGMVAHTPIDSLRQEALRKEFTELFFPGTVNIPAENDHLTFAFTSRWAEIVARYIMGIAATVSGDLDFALELYADAQAKLENKPENFPIFNTLSSRIPSRISEINFAKARITHSAWTKSHDSRLVDQLGDALNKIGPDRDNDPGTLTIRAIHAVLANRDTKSARGLLERIPKARRDGAWHYNMAFVEAFEGNLKKAAQHYRNGSRVLVDSTIVEQVEDFLCNLLSQEPDKVQIHFCLGLFNWRVKGDSLRAIKDFELFLSNCPHNTFEDQKPVVRKWIENLQNQTNSETNLVSK